MLSHEDNERLVRVGKGTPLGELFRLYWIPFLPSADLAQDGQPQRIRLLGEDLVAFRDSEGRVGPGRPGLPASRRSADLRPQRGLRAALRLSRLEVRCDGRGHGHAGRAGAQPPQGAGAHQGVSMPRAQRHDLDLYGPGPGRSAAAAERRMESRAAGAGACQPARPGVQLAAGRRRRDRFGARAVAAWPAGRPGHDECVDPEAGPSSDVRMHQAGFRDEHRCAAQLRRQHALLAREPVHAAVLHAGPAAVAVPGSQRARLGADRRREHALHHVLIPSFRAALPEDTADLRGRAQWPRERARQPQRARSACR